MGVASLHGFQREEVNVDFKFLNEEVNETLLIEADSVLDRWDQIQDDLPAYGGASGNMPDGSTITFTLGRSPHPHRSRLILREATNLRKVKNSGNFWEIDLLYNMDVSDQEVQDPQDPENSQVIILPWQKAPVWQAGNSITEHETFQKPNGDLIRHTNGAPITEPISVPLQHTSHTFTWNIKWDILDYDRDIEKYVNSINKQTMWNKPVGTWKLTNTSATEMWERIPFDEDVSGEYSFHYARITATFEHNPEGWNTAPFSKSTWELSVISLSPLLYGLAPITVNSRGDFAEEPWPLQDDGTAVPYNSLDDSNLYARIDTGWTPADQPASVDIWDFADRWNLSIPGVPL